MTANFVFRNDNDFDVKDVEVRCVHYAKSGTEIDRNTRTIYEIFKARSERSIRNFQMGFIHNQAARSGCIVTKVVPMPSAVMTPTMPLPKPRPSQASQDTKSANEAHNRLLRLSDSERNVALTSFMQVSGEHCRVTMSFFQDMSKDKGAFWNVACSTGTSFSIKIANDKEGSTKILSCEVLRAIANVECFKKFSSQ